MQTLIFNQAETIYQLIQYTQMILLIVFTFGMFFPIFSNRHLKLVIIIILYFGLAILLNIINPV